MADHTVSISTNYESEGGGFYTISFLPNNATLKTGDKLFFRWVSHTGGNEPTRLTVEGFNTSAFDSGANLLIEDNNSVPVFRTVDTDTTQSVILTVLPSSGNGSKNFTANVSSNIDSTPDTFDLGSPQTQANPGSVYSADFVKVLGVTPATDISVTITNGAETSLDGITFSTAPKIAYLDDVIYTRMVAPPYGQSTTTTLSMNGVTDTWTISTRIDPENGQKLYFGRGTGDVKLSDIASFFGVFDLFADLKLTNYYKNNTLVPDISENSTIPVSGEIKLTNFRGAATSFYFSEFPANKFERVNTLNAGTQTYYIPFDLDTDWNMGFGPGMNDASEFKMEFIEQWLSVGGGNRTANTDVTVFGTGKTSYSLHNNSFVLQVTAGQSVEKHYEGTMRIWARSSFDNNVTAFVDVNYEYFFFNQ